MLPPLAQWIEYRIPIPLVEGSSPSGRAKNPSQKAWIFNYKKGDNMKEHIITENEGGQRLDKFLSKRFKTMPTSLIYKYIRTKKIKLNGKKATASDFVSVGDKLTFYISDEFFANDAEEKAYTHIKAQLSVVYEDNNILIADKPVGLLCHSDDKEGYNTLINHIKAYLADKNEYNGDEAFAPALCNRIDRNTCGLVIAAKNAVALREMNEIIKKHCVAKKYLAAVHGIPQKQGTITGYLRKDGDANRVYLSDKRISPDEKQAITKYRLLETDGEISLIEAELVTGRTHQIRAQLASIGHPLLGDGKYAVNTKDRRLGYNHQSLCAYSLKFLKYEDAKALAYLEGKSFYSSSPVFLKLFKYRF